MSQWMSRNEWRARILHALDQPMTASQLARRLSASRTSCSRTLRDLAGQRLTRCLNPGAGKSRLYGLTRRGAQARRELGGSTLSSPKRDHPLWALAGWVSFTHRSAILRALGPEPAPASGIRHRACFRDSALRMSASNCRGVLKLFHGKGLVTRELDPKLGLPLYALTDLGRDIQRLLLAAESVPIRTSAPEGATGSTLLGSHSGEGLGPAGTGDRSTAGGGASAHGT
ncbi:MAG: winged helix-turn-helix transcriptional regulator [Phycisphaerales bacterium]|nr:winged helix-turn-helix transcriptional regulator [Phycisphaerales bacterium]